LSQLGTAISTPRPRASPTTRSGYCRAPAPPPAPTGAGPRRTRRHRPIRAQAEYRVSPWACPASCVGRHSCRLGSGRRFR
jgi:hypothetical protein